MRAGDDQSNGGVSRKSKPLERGKEHWGQPDFLCSTLGHAFQADGAVGFSLRVTAAAQLGDSEGLALGFTTRPPNELETLPSTADEVDPSYLLGFDGAAWDGSALKWHFSHWQPQTLKAFDRVDVLLEKHRLQVAVNGSRVAAQHMQVSSLQGPFYALLDIASAGMGEPWPREGADVGGCGSSGRAEWKEIGCPWSALGA
eukprot:g22108.t1